MKVLILSCSTGGGHNAAAKAIQQELLERGDSCTICNALDFTPRIKKAITENGHTILYKWAPELYGEQYEKIAKKKSHLMLYLDYGRFAPAISAYVNENKFDVVICVHVFPAIMLSVARRLFNVKAKLYFVATDYSVAPGLGKTRVDALFVPVGCSEMFQKKLPKSNVVETGIPVDTRYHKDFDKLAARKILGIRDDNALVLIGAGSIGCGPIRQIADKIKEDMGSDGCVVVLCGNNTKLQEELAVEIKDAHFLAIGFTENVFYWTKAADVVISKAGGLSITEITNAGVPLICMDAVPGLERQNLETMVQCGCALTAESIDEICELAKKLCRDTELRKEIISKQRNVFSINSAKMLVDYIKEG